jgi:hypothetical protein
VADGPVADMAVLPRGNYLKPGKVVPRHFPTVLAGRDQPAISAKQSGRLELAQWLVRRDHPLTARVMVNRVWRWHFGEGLVRSTDNFGKLGEKPSHPELLDWLALRFADGGWSLKDLHREILLSATYRMSSAHDRQAAEKDPENRLLWRFPIRRLEVEAIRDSLLAVSGLLDRTPGGPVLHVKNREFLFDHTSKDTTTYDSVRRSLYLPVIRNNVYDVFELFDFGNPAVPTGDRDSTTVAPQALFLLNSDLVLRAAESLAAGLLRDESNDAARLRTLYRKAYGREPSVAEVARATSLLARTDEMLRDREPDGAKRRRQAWTLLCQTVLAASEFIYVS